MLDWREPCCRYDCWRDVRFLHLVIHRTRRINADHEYSPDFLLLRSSHNPGLPSMTPFSGRTLMASIALLLLVPGPPIYPGAKCDVPTALIEKSSGVEASATYVTPDAFEKVDSFYRGLGTEDTAARRISPSS